MNYPKQIIIPGKLYEPSIEDRMKEMEAQDQIDDDESFSFETYRDYATEEYLANHDDYVKLALEINK